MSAIYEKATPEAIERVKRIVGKHHFELESYEVKIDLVFARSAVNDDGTPTGPALTHQGYPADGLARIISSKDRVMGRGDCEIVIDADHYDQMSEDEKDALFDHEIQHFQLKVDKYAVVQYDDSRRPKMKLRKHDAQFGWFHTIAGRYGLASAEVRQFRALCEDHHGQYYLPFINPNTEFVSPSLKESIKGFRSLIKSSGGTVTMKSGDRSVTIGSETPAEAVTTK